MRLRARWRRTARFCGPPIEAVSRLILVHDDIEDPVQAVLDAPVGADDRPETLGRKRRAEQIIGRFGGGFGGGFAAVVSSNDGQAGPLMIVLQPADVGRDGAGSRLDPAVVALDGGMAGRRRALRIVQKRWRRRAACPG